MKTYVLKPLFDKKRLQHNGFPENIAKFLRIPMFIGVPY